MRKRRRQTDTNELGGNCGSAEILGVFDTEDGLGGKNQNLVVRRRRRTCRQTCRCRQIKKRVDDVEETLLLVRLAAEDDE